MSFLDSVKAIPITDLAEKMGFRLVKKGKYYSLEEHDSVMIDTEKNCFWRNSCFSKGFKGGAGSSIDFYMEFTGETDCKETMKRLAAMYGIGNENYAPMTHQKKIPDLKNEKLEVKKTLVMPAKDKDNNAVLKYLIGRGISETIIKYFIELKMLYQDKRRNCVFVSALNDFACIRSTGQKKFLTDCQGCNYEHGFFFKASDDAKHLIVAESVINIMSIMTMFEMERKNYKKYAYLATSGTNKIQSLNNHLKEQQQIECVWLCNDRDEAGEKADKKAIEGMKKIGFKGKWHIKKSPSGFNDWNDYIKSLAQENKKNGGK